MIHTCPRCELRFRSESELAQHMALDHDAEPLERYTYRSSREVEPLYGRRERAQEQPRRYLVVANQTLGDTHLVERLKELAAQGPPAAWFEGEFAALDRAEATRRIASGRLWCARHGLAVRGFVAPAWLLGRESWEALSDFEFDYTTTLTRFVELRGGRSVPAPGIVYSARSRARRVLSCGWNALLARVAHAAPLVRVGLHPVDTCHPQVLHHAQALVRRLARHRECLTKRHVAARLRGRAA